MSKVRFSHQITEKRKSGTVNQEMILSVDYDFENDHVDNPEVHIYENGKLIGEISKLLDKAEGDPLTTMIEAIDWRQLYCDNKVDDKEVYKTSIMEDMLGIKSLLEKF